MRGNVGRKKTGSIFRDSQEIGETGGKVVQGFRENTGRWV